MPRFFGLRTHIFAGLRATFEHCSQPQARLLEFALFAHLARCAFFHEGVKRLRFTPTFFERSNDVLDGADLCRRRRTNNVEAVELALAIASALRAHDQVPRGGCSCFRSCNSQSCRRPQAVGAAVGSGAQVAKAPSNRKIRHHDDGAVPATRELVEVFSDRLEFLALAKHLRRRQ
ncbi:hypothetical protein D3C87_1009270 [compost metagenome]